MRGERAKDVDSRETLGTEGEQQQQQCSILSPTRDYHLLPFVHSQMTSPDMHSLSGATAQTMALQVLYH